MHLYHQQYVVSEDGEAHVISNFLKHKTVLSKFGSVIVLDWQSSIKISFFCCSIPSLHGLNVNARVKTLHICRTALSDTPGEKHK